MTESKHVNSTSLGKPMVSTVLNLQDALFQVGNGILHKGLGYKFIPLQRPQAQLLSVVC